MLEKLLARLQAFLDGAFVPKAELEQATVKIGELTERCAHAEAKVADYSEASKGDAKLLSEATANLSTVTTERDALKAENETLKANAKTVDEAAAVKAREICSAQGIPAGQVPKQEEIKSISNAAELDKVRAQIATEKDPKKRYELATKARELRGHSDLFKTN